MDINKFEEHDLDSFLDEESQEEFGEPVIRDRYDHMADAYASGNLKNWTAQDFASIYVRFRPHLERHAKRYLSNPVQAEEVVQDAFLYVMTTLPELDSELGVLKFLKWKIRLLSLDILRSASNQRETSVPEHAEYAADDQEITADLERAEDNAVIRMALARLNPRQREALVASVYEEKSSDEIADQLGLSPNAARQLLFRARSAFKKALVGEAEIQGKSISQVLTIAAKKAALDARENAAKVGAFIVIAAIGIGVLPQLMPGEKTTFAEAPISQIPSQPTEDVAPEASLEVPQLEEPTEVAQPIEESTSQASVEIPAEDPYSNTVEANIAAEAEQVGVTTEQVSAAPAEPERVNPLTDDNLSTILTTNVTNAGFYEGSYASKFAEAFHDVSIEVFGGTGISAFLDVDTQSLTVDSVLFQMWIEGERYFGVARESQYLSLPRESGVRVEVSAQEFYVADEDGNVYSESPLTDARALITLDLDAAGAPYAASMRLSEIKAP